MFFGDLEDQVNSLVKAFTENVRTYKPDELGLDYRAGWGLMVLDDGIACPKGAQRSLEYYGGFEYIDSDDKSVLGDMVFYSSEDERVQHCMDRAARLIIAEVE